MRKKNSDKHNMMINEDFYETLAITRGREIIPGDFIGKNIL